MCSIFYFRLNSDDFVMEQKKFNYIKKIKAGNTSKIKSIKKDYLYSNNKKIPIVNIKAGFEKYNINEGLKEAEIDWLVKEINDWLYK